MPFNCIDTNNFLKPEVLDLLDTIDNFKLSNAWEISCLKELHDRLSIEIVDHLDDEESVLTIDKKEAGSILERWTKENEEIGRYNQQILEKAKNDIRFNVEFYLHSKWPVEDLQKQIDSGADEIKLKFLHRTLGCYTRINGAGYIKLVGSYNIPLESLISTYLHEMMHAYLDSRMMPEMNDVKYAEEPIVEFGMLLILDEFCKANPQYKMFLQYAYRSVLCKQNSVGLEHYGLGAELFEKYRDQEWISLAFRGSPLRSKNRYYIEYKDFINHYLTNVFSSESTFCRSRTFEHAIKLLVYFLCRSAKKEFIRCEKSSFEVPFVNIPHAIKGRLMMNFRIHVQKKILDKNLIIYEGMDLKAVVENRDTEKRNDIIKYGSEIINLFSIEGEYVGCVPCDYTAILSLVLKIGGTLNFVVKRIHDYEEQQVLYIEVFS